MVVVYSSHYKSQAASIFKFPRKIDVDLIQTFRSLSASYCVSSDLGNSGISSERPPAERVCRIVVGRESLYSSSDAFVALHDKSTDCCGGLRGHDNLIYALQSRVAKPLREIIESSACLDSDLVRVAVYVLFNMGCVAQPETVVRCLKHPELSDILPLAMDIALANNKHFAWASSLNPAVRRFELPAAVATRDIATRALGDLAAFVNMSVEQKLDAVISAMQPLLRLPSDETQQKRG